MNLEPIKTQRLIFDKLPATHQAAIIKNYNATGSRHDKAYFATGVEVRVETYAAADIKKLIGELWKWQVSLAELKRKGYRSYHRTDIRRIERIMKLIPVHGQWPYVSYWATDMDELKEVGPDDEVFNHGDGWHRCIAAFELNLPTIDIVYV